MTREEAYQAMQNGNKITHNYFTPDEYYEIKDGKIIAEDGVDHTSTFWSEDGNNWRKIGWFVKE